MGFAMPELCLFSFAGKNKCGIGDPLVVCGVVAIQGDGDTWFGKDRTKILAKVRAAFVKSAVASFVVPFAIGGHDRVAFSVGFIPQGSMKEGERGEVWLPEGEGEVRSGWREPLGWGCVDACKPESEGF
jgi:hypothetical protein